MSSALHMVSTSGVRRQLNTVIRTLLAIFGGYGLAALTAATFALALPLPRVDAVMAAMMLAFVVYLLAVIWVFATSTLTRVFIGLLLPAAILGIWYAFLLKGMSA